MALILTEGFDHYDRTLMTAKGWTANFASAMATGRVGGQAANSSNTASKKALPSTYSTLFVGFAFQIATLGAGNFDIAALAVSTGVTNAMKIHVDATGHLAVLNSGSTTIATGTTVLNINTWYYVELKGFINGASGTCELHLNGSSGEITSTTGNFGSINFDTITLNPSAVSGPAIKFDDIYVVDTSGPAPRNTFLGDVRVATLMPNGDGTHSQATPDSGTSHFARVDEILADGDTSYVFDSNVGDMDTYTVPASIPSAATVYGVQHNLYERKDDAGTRQIAPVIRQGGTDFVGTAVAPSLNYAFASQIYNQDPTGSDWTPANVNGDEYGFQVAA